VPVVGKDSFSDNDGRALSHHVPDNSAWVNISGYPEGTNLVIYNNTLGWFYNGYGNPGLWKMNLMNIRNGYIQAKYLSFTGPAAVSLCGRIKSDLSAWVELGPGSGDGYFLLKSELSSVRIPVIENPGVILKMLIVESIAIAYVDGVASGSVNTNLYAGGWGIFPRTSPIDGPS
jgi:hypothetical protein